MHLGRRSGEGSSSSEEEKKRKSKVEEKKKREEEEVRRVKEEELLRKKQEEEEARRRYEEKVRRDEEEREKQEEEKRRKREEEENRKAREEEQRLREEALLKQKMKEEELRRKMVLEEELRTKREEEEEAKRKEENERKARAAELRMQEERARLAREQMKREEEEKQTREVVSTSSDELSEHSVELKQETILKAAHIKGGHINTSGRLEELAEFPPPPPPLETQSSTEGKSDSSTSSSSTSEYEALYESKSSMADVACGYKPANQGAADPRKAPGYHLKKPSEYHLTDCTSINTRGRSYSQVVEEHLSRSPSLQTTSAGDTSSDEGRKVKAQQGTEKSSSRLPPLATAADSDSSLSSLPPPPPHIAAGVDKVENIANKMKTRVDSALEKKDEVETAISEEEYQRMVREKEEFFQSGKDSGAGTSYSDTPPIFRTACCHN